MEQHGGLYVSIVNCGKVGRVGHGERFHRNASFLRRYVPEKIRTIGDSLSGCGADSPDMSPSVDQPFGEL